MQLYFARHAESFNNGLEGHADYYTRRRADPELTRKGQEQAGHLARLLAEGRVDDGDGAGHRPSRNPWNHDGFGLTHVYSSLQRRAVETAITVADAVQLDPVGWPDLHECGGVVDYDPGSGGFRGAAGATPEDLHRWAPKMEVLGPVDEKGWWAGRDLETHEESGERADRVFRRILDVHGGTDDHVLLVSHSMFYVFFMCRVLGLRFSSEIWFTLSNAALTRLDVGDGDDFEPGLDAGRRKLPGLPVRIMYQNRMDHLPADAVS